MVSHQMPKRKARAFYKRLPFILHTKQSRTM